MTLRTIKKRQKLLKQFTHCDFLLITILNSAAENIYLPHRDVWNSPVAILLTEATTKWPPFAYNIFEFFFLNEFFYFDKNFIEVCFQASC